MANGLASGRSFVEVSRFPQLNDRNKRDRVLAAAKVSLFLAAAMIFSSLVLGQGAPQVTAVDPAAGKVNDTITVSGDNLGKASVSSVYLSDDKNDYKATIVSQTDDKIAMKVPQVKPGDYNISIQVGDKLFIKPVRFKVEE